jgi:hypothetical protein
VHGWLARLLQDATVDNAKLSLNVMSDFADNSKAETRPMSSK